MRNTQRVAYSEFVAEEILRHYGRLFKSNKPLRSHLIKCSSATANFGLAHIFTVHTHFTVDCKTALDCHVARRLQLTQMKLSTVIILTL